MQEKILKHFSSLTGVELQIFDVKLKDFKNSTTVYCAQCPKKCNYKNIHLYGCYESVRWDNKYIYYCPQDFIFVAIPVLDEYELMDSGIVAGPILMGEVEDFAVATSLPRMETAKVNDFAEIASVVFAGKKVQKNKESVVDFLNAIYRELEILPKREEYPIDEEKKLQDAIIEGNESEAREHLNRLLGEIFFRSHGNFSVIKARALELLVLLSRSSIEGGADMEQIFALNNSYIQEIDKIDTNEKLTVWLSSIINRFMSYMFEFSDVKHSVTIHKITGYIRDHYMDKISLDDIADYVYLSKSYISKIFNKEMNMSISAYINKVRIEKSKHMLHDGTLTIADIANYAGFDDQSYFSKQFRAETGVTPKQFREKIFGGTQK